MKVIELLRSKEWSGKVVDCVLRFALACALAGAGLWGVSGACAQHLFSHYGITPMFAPAVR